MSVLIAVMVSALMVSPAPGQTDVPGGVAEISGVDELPIADVPIGVRGPNEASQGATSRSWCSGRYSAQPEVRTSDPASHAMSACGSVWSAGLRHTPTFVSAEWSTPPSTATALDGWGIAETDRRSIDLVVASAIRDSGVQENEAVGTVSTVFRRASLPGTLLLAAALYGLGELEDRPDLAELGLNTGRAVVGAGAVTLVGKIATGRARPRIAPDDPTDFLPGRGFRSDDYQAFPSAHTAAAFAAATVLSADLGDRHPGSASWIYPSIYSAATMAGLSRIIDEEHWLTDTLAGGLIGVLGGLYVNSRYASEATSDAR